MANDLFRKKSLDRFSSPEDLNRCLSVTNPGIWTVLLAVVLFLAGLLVWAGTATLETKISAVAEISRNEAVITVTGSDAESVKIGMPVYIANEYTEIDSIETDEYGRAVCYAISNQPNGRYKAEIVLESITPLSFLMR